MHFKRTLCCSSVLLFALSFGASTALAQESIGPRGQRATLFSGPSTRLIVKYRESGSATLSATRRQRAMDRFQRMSSARLAKIRQLANGADLIRATARMADRDVDALMAEIRKDPDVAYVERDALMQPLFTPNDPRYSDQWHYFESTAGIRMPSAWDISTGAGAVVAVLDTGYRPHPDLVGNLVGGYDFIDDTFVSVDGDGRDSDATDPGDWYTGSLCGPSAPPSANSSWHGTHVAGTIAATTNDGRGVAGVAFNATVVPVRVLGRCGGYLSDIADGVIWASGGSVPGVPSNPNPADVINMSLGGGGACGTTYQNAIDIARANGATVVVSAGNSNTNASNARPANCNGVITVAATDRNGSRAYYSNFGSTVEIAAPGGDIRGSGGVNAVLSTLNSGNTTPGSNNYEFYQGTSMAAPHVAGVAALLYSLDPSLTPTDVETILTGSARSLPGSCSGGCGAGLLDAYAAVQAVSGTPPPPPPPTPTCPAGSTTYSGSISTSGAYNLEPNGTYYFSSAGTHEGTLFGPSGADFDLRLYRWNGGGWQIVARAETASSDEDITYSGSSGYYMWMIRSFSGTGAYTFCLDRP